MKPSARDVIFEAACGAGPLAGSFLSFDEASGVVTFAATNAVSLKPATVKIHIGDLWYVTEARAERPKRRSRIAVSEQISGARTFDLMWVGTGQMMVARRITPGAENALKGFWRKISSPGWVVDDDGVGQPGVTLSTRTARLLQLECARTILCSKADLARALARFAHGLPTADAGRVVADVESWLVTLEAQVAAVDRMILHRSRPDCDPMARSTLPLPEFTVIPFASTWFSVHGDGAALFGVDVYRTAGEIFFAQFDTSPYRDGVAALTVAVNEMVDASGVSSVSFRSVPSHGLVTSALQAWAPQSGNCLAEAGVLLAGAAERFECGPRDDPGSPTSVRP